MKLKLISTLIFLFAYFLSFGQDNWSGLSANQKIKIAKKEQKAAKKDKEYLLLMDEALQLFQNKEYEAAQKKYEAAHLRRPDNVYPMVMLDDIEIALKMMEEEKTAIVKEEIPEEKPFVEPEIIEKEEIADEKPSVPNAEPQVQEPISLPKDPEIKIAETQKPSLSPELNVIIKQEPKIYLEDGTYFKNFKEGNANVDEIEIIEKGVKTSYRKVSHSWGAVYYFKNKDSISKEEWIKIYQEAKQD